MNRYAKASAPITWPGPRAGQPDGGGMSLPSPRLTPTLGANYNVRGLAAQLALPCVPPTGFRGKALMSIPKAWDDRPSQEYRTLFLLLLQLRCQVMYPRTVYYHIASRTVTIGERCSIESARHWICSCFEDLRSIGNTAASKCRCLEGLDDIGNAAASRTCAALHMQLP